MRPAAAGAILAAGCALLGCGDAAQREARLEDPRRNVLVITLDTTRADALGAYGQPLPATPRIDAAAADGTVFEQVRSSSPSTFPAHASLFTGQHPYAHGVRANAGYVLADESTTLAERLRDAGWRTGAEVAAMVLGRFQRLDQGLDSYGDPLSADEGGGAATRDAIDVTDQGLAFLREYRHEPFFLWLHYYDPHSPFVPPAPYSDLFPDDPYLGEVRFVDDQVGRVLDEIQALGLRDQTLVAITSDHGARGRHPHILRLRQHHARSPGVVGCRRNPTRAARVEAGAPDRRRAYVARSARTATPPGRPRSLAGTALGRSRRRARAHRLRRVLRTAVALR
jgi:arylsulfatase A-like enzyme